LTFKLDEVGWQVTIPSGSRKAYFGRESVRPTDEKTQAKIYGELVAKVACDPSVRALLFFGLIDGAIGCLPNSTPAATPVATRNRRRSKRSASAPPNGPRSTVGT
jgi:hypothetical protein